MNFYIKQKIFDGINHFSIKDEMGKDVYIAKNPDKAIIVGLQLGIFDTNNNEIATISQKGISLNPTFKIHSQGLQIATIIKKMSMFKPKYVVPELNWEIQGDFLAHEYEISDGISTVAKIHKELFNFIDTFVLEIDDTRNIITALSCVFVIDYMVDQEGNGWKIK